MLKTKLERILGGAKAEPARDKSGNQLLLGEGKRSDIFELGQQGPKAEGTEGKGVQGEDALFGRDV